MNRGNIVETKENKENNKSRQRMFLVVFLVILQAVIGITYSFNSDKVNNNLHWHKRYYEAVDNILSEDFVTASAQLYFVYDELGDYRNTKYFYDYFFDYYEAEDFFTNIINQNQIESTYKECVRDKLDDRTTTCLTVRCQCLNDGLYITPVVPTGVFYALFIVEIIILKEIFYENT